MPLDDAEVVDLHEQVTCLDFSIVLHIELDDTLDEWHQGLQLFLLCLFRTYLRELFCYLTFQLSGKQRKIKILLELENAHALDT